MVFLREAGKEDAMLLFNWANEKETRSMSVHSGEITWKDHIAWFEKKLVAVDTKIFILTSGTDNIGQIRFENKNNEWLIGYSIDEKFRGKGYGRQVVVAGMEKIGNGTFTAFVKPGNTASMKIFSSLGFLEAGTELQEDTLLVKFKLEKKA